MQGACPSEGDPFFHPGIWGHGGPQPGRLYIRPQQGLRGETRALGRHMELAQDEGLLGASRERKREVACKD